MMDMKKSTTKPNLLGGEEENVQEETPQKVTLTVEGYLTQAGAEYEKRGKAYYIYASSLQEVKTLIEKMPNPAENEYAIIPLGESNGYTVFVMVTKGGISVRIGYGRNSIPYNSSLSAIIGKLEKVAKEIGVESRKNSKNLIEV